MTHTEESLMALAEEYANAVDCFAAVTASEKREALRIDIREVLAERDALAMQLKLKPAPMADCPVYCKTAVDLRAEVERLRKDAERWKGLRKLAGFVEDGSNETVRLYQDDATKDWFVSVGKCNWFGSSLSAAIDAAIKDQP